MLITDVPSTFDPTLPLHVPQLPNPETHRFVADSLLVDGAVSAWPAVQGGLSYTQATASQRPVASTVDGLRGITLDGTDDIMVAVGSGVGVPLKMTTYVVFKMNAVSSSTELIFEVASGFFFGINGINRLCVTGSTGTVQQASTAVAGQWVVAAFFTDKTPAAGSQRAKLITSVDPTPLESSAMTLGTMPYSDIRFGSTSAVNSPSLTYRDIAMAYNVEHTTAQMQTNIAALKAEYAIF